MVSSTGVVRGSGGALFAAILLIVAGSLQALEGLAAVVKGSFFITPVNYFITTSAANWGWIHIVVGLLVLVTGFAVLWGAAWARVVGIVLACGAVLTNFLYIPYYPFWSVLIIAISLWVIHSLAVYRPSDVY